MMRSKIRVVSALCALWVSAGCGGNDSQGSQFGSGGNAGATGSGGTGGNRFIDGKDAAAGEGGSTHLGGDASSNENDARVEIERPPPDAKAERASPCVFVKNEAPIVKEMITAAAPPTPTGGTIEAGVYFLTSITYYGADPSCPLNSVQSTMVLTPSSDTAGTFDDTTRLTAPSDTGDQLSAGTYSIDGDSMTMSFQCPLEGGAFLHYTATPTGLTMFPLRYEHCGTTVEVFAKQ